MLSTLPGTSCCHRPSGATCDPKAAYIQVLQAGDSNSASHRNHLAKCVAMPAPSPTSDKQKRLKEGRLLGLTRNKLQAAGWQPFLSFCLSPLTEISRPRFDGRWGMGAQKPSLEDAQEMIDRECCAEECAGHSVLAWTRAFDLGVSRMTVLFLLSNSRSGFGSHIM